MQRNIERLNSVLQSGSRLSDWSMYEYVPNHQTLVLSTEFRDIDGKLKINYLQFSETELIAMPFHIIGTLEMRIKNNNLTDELLEIEIRTNNEIYSVLCRSVALDDNLVIKIDKVDRWSPYTAPDARIYLDTADELKIFNGASVVLVSIVSSHEHLVFRVEGSRSDVQQAHLHIFGASFLRIPTNLGRAHIHVTDAFDPEPFGFDYPSVRKRVGHDRWQIILETAAGRFSVLASFVEIIWCSE
jgi:hypothetical protein